MRHAYCPLLCGILLLVSEPAHALESVLRDSIGPDSNLTDGLGGASAAHDGGVWNTPGMVVDVPETGDLAEVKIVLFAGTALGQPENTLANILGYNMDFHIWSDGIQSGPDSFFDNAIGQVIPGHTKVEVNRSTGSFISVQAFGMTGPPADPTLFTTFLVTIDLSSFNLQLQGGQQYVLGVTSPFGNFITGAGASFRQIHSRNTGFEDLFLSNDTPLAQRPGFLNSQHGFGVDQLAGAVSIDVPILGDMDGDDNVTLLDAPLLVQALIDRAAYDDQNFTTAAGLLVDAD